MEDPNLRATARQTVRRPDASSHHLRTDKEGGKADGGLEGEEGGGYAGSADFGPTPPLFNALSLGLSGEKGGMRKEAVQHSSPSRFDSRRATQ